MSEVVSVGLQHKKNPHLQSSYPVGIFLWVTSLQVWESHTLWLFFLRVCWEKRVSAL